MFKVGDKVVPNGFRYKGYTHKHGTDLIMLNWAEESKVLTVCSIEQADEISVTDGFNTVLYHPSELRIATEKEIEALNKRDEQKFDFDNYFYVLELNDSTIFISAYIDDDAFIWELSDEDETDTSFVEKGFIKKIIAIIPKR